jgi:sodium transport system permease protein
VIQAKDIRLLYLRELRSALRERNIVVNSILLPIFLYPFMLWLVYTGISFVGGQTRGFSSRVMFQDTSEQHHAFKIDLQREKQIELMTTPHPAEDIRKGLLDVLVEILPPDVDASFLKGNFRARLTHDDSKDRSRVARERISERLGRYRDRRLEEEARKLGLSPEQLQQFWVETTNIATTRQMGQFLLGLMLPMFLVIMLAVGCMYPAIDCTAGEREKSTWETLMTTGTSRTNIVVAKYLYVATLAAVAAILNLAAMLFSMKSVMAPIMGDRGASFSFEIPLQSLPLILVVTILLALFVAAGMMILASFARTFKEGQSMVSPFYLAILLPVMFLQVPGLEFSPLLAVIPVVNVVMVFREAIAGVFHWPLIGITIAVEIACIALALWLATTILRYEDFMLGSYGGSLGKFLKERLGGGKKRAGATA